MGNVTVVIATYVAIPNALIIAVSAAIAEIATNKTFSEKIYFYNKDQS